MTSRSTCFVGLMGRLSMFAVLLVRFVLSSAVSELDNQWMDWGREGRSLQAVLRSGVDEQQACLMRLRMALQKSPVCPFDLLRITLGHPGPHCTHLLGQDVSKSQN